MPQSPPRSPLDHAERMPVLDALRGFALGGVLTANLLVFSGWGILMSPAQQHALPTAAIDSAVDWLLLWLVDGKFYSLFSLLFGLGFGLQLARETQSVIRLRRRLAWLLVVGLLHATVFWFGDILSLYAALGFVLLAFRNTADRALVRWAAALLVCPVAVQALGVLVGRYPWDALYSVASGADPIAEAFQVFQTGSFSAILKENLLGLIFRYLELFETVRFPRLLGLFLVGLWLSRDGRYRELLRREDLLRLVQRTGLGLGLVLNAAYATLLRFEPERLSVLDWVGGSCYAIGVPLLAAGYAATFALWWNRPRRRTLLARLVPAGRMALTNYLGQTAIGLLLFYPYGLGWFGRVGPALTTVLAGGILLGQLLVSRWWLARYRFGPLEWLWRQWTYRQRLPLGAMEERAPQVQ